MYPLLLGYEIFLKKKISYPNTLLPLGFCSRRAEKDDTGESLAG